MAPYLDGQQRHLPTALDRIVVAGAGDQLVELFLVVYHQQRSARDLSPLGHMCCRIEPKAPVSENTRRILKASFGRIQV
jgi:hypothetical protein